MDKPKSSRSVFRRVAVVMCIRDARHRRRKTAGATKKRSGAAAAPAVFALRCLFPPLSAAENMRSRVSETSNYFFLFATSLPKSNKCSGLKAFFDHRQASENSTPTKKPISR